MVVAAQVKRINVRRHLDKGRKDLSQFLARFAESWRDATRDVVLIVVSIIIAFAVDAWWEELAEQRQEQDHLAALLAEFEVVRLGLDAQLSAVARSRGATEEILRLTGPSPSSVSADSLAGLINDSFNLGVFASAGGALQALLASGGLSLIQSDSLSALLAEWPRLRESIAANEELLVLGGDPRLPCPSRSPDIPGREQPRLVGHSTNPVRPRCCHPALERCDGVDVRDPHHSVTVA